MTTSAAGRVSGECRHCGEPIRLVPGRRPTWIHTGPDGAFYCRDGDTGLFFASLAEPTQPPRPSEGRRRSGRHAVGMAPGTDTQRAARYPDR